METGDKGIDLVFRGLKVQVKTTQNRNGTLILKRIHELHSWQAPPVCDLYIFLRQIEPGSLRFLVEYVPAKFAHDRAIVTKVKQNLPPCLAVPLECFRPIEDFLGSVEGYI